MIENYLITGLPIRTEKFGIIYQPTIKELLLLGYTNKEIVQPFLLDLDLVVQDEGIKKILKNFDLFFLSNNGLVDNLLEKLKILYKTENVKISSEKLIERKSIIVDDNIVINRDNYDVLVGIILGMFGAEKSKRVEEEKVNLPTEKHKQIWEKLKSKKAKKELQNQVELCDIINIVCHANGFIPYNVVVDLTYYQLINSYKTLMCIENYKEFVQFKLSTKYEINKDINHWINETKVSKVPSIE